MKNLEQSGENYSSDAIEQLLSAITPEEQYRIDCRMKLASKIYAGIKDKGWKNLDLAGALNLKSPSLVSKWLSGTHNFTIDTLTDIQRVLGIRLLDIEPAPTQPVLNVSFAVEPASLAQDLHAPLQKVIDETGGLQATTITVKRT